MSGDLAEGELRKIVLRYAAEIRGQEHRIRALQDEMHSKIPLTQWVQATTALDAILGREKVIHVAEIHNSFENVGVANTGSMAGSIAGHSQEINLNQGGQELIEALLRFKQSIEHDQSLSADQRSDAIAASSELELEVRKPEGACNMSRVRNGVAALKTLASGAGAIHSLYDAVHPLLMAHFHLPM
jgi:hypothetical protein